MRTLLKIVLSLAGTLILALLVAVGWCYSYSRDLPDVTIIGQFAPPAVKEVFDPCIGRSTAIPYEAIGSNLRNAISAAETSESDPGVLRALWIDLFEKGGYSGVEGSGRKTLNASLYIAQSLCYPASKQTKRTIAELRAAIQLERRYSRRQLFTAFSNRVHFGPNLFGVHDASEFYFRKAPAQLNISEAALLISLIYSPSMYSPIKHPDRALFRRNQIIDRMLLDGFITTREAQDGKAVPLPIVPPQDPGHNK